MADETTPIVQQSTIVKKHMIAVFLDTGNDISNPNFTRIKKSVEFSLALNPETVVYDYIADESPTEELDKYKPSISQPLTMYKGEPDFDMIFDRFFNLDVGLEAHARVMLVFMFDGTPEKGYKAWESDCVISIDTLDSVASQITFNVLFGGTVRKGLATMVDGKPAFTEGIPEEPVTPPSPPDAGGEDNSGGSGTDTEEPTGLSGYSTY